MIRKLTVENIIQFLQIIVLINTVIVSVVLQVGQMESFPTLALLLTSLLASLVRQELHSIQFKKCLNNQSHKLNKFIDENFSIVESLSISALYNKFSKKTQDANSFIYLTSLQPKDPSQAPIPEVREYFSKISNLIKDQKKQQNIQIKRLVTIESQEKLDWVYNEVINNRNNKQLSINYIKANIEGKTSSSKPLNLQVIDDLHLFLINSVHGYDDHLSQGLYLSNKKIITQVFIRYYEEYWNSSTPLLTKGKINESNLNELKQRFTGYGNA